MSGTDITLPPGGNPGVRSPNHQVINKHHGAGRTWSAVTRKRRSNSTRATAGYRQYMNFSNIYYLKNYFRAWRFVNRIQDGWA